MNINKLLEQIKEKNRKDLAEHNIMIGHHLAKEASEAKEIITYLESIGVNRSQIDTNNYWFHIKHHGLMIDFVNQETRFCVTIFKEAINDDEKELFKEARWLIQHLSSGCESILEREIRQFFSVYHFIVEGSVLNNVQETMRRAHIIADDINHGRPLDCSGSQF